MRAYLVVETKNHHSINGLICFDSCRFLAPAADLLSRGPLMGGIYYPLNVELDGPKRDVSASKRFTVLQFCS